MNSNKIILLHGALGALDQLNKLKEELIEKGYNVFSFNFSGHGKEAFHEQFNLKQFADELESFVVTNKLIQPNIFGYSMGGYVALFLANQKPDLLGNIITLGTKFKWNEEISKREIQNLIPDIIETKVPKFALALKERHGEEWKLLLKRTSDMMLEMGKKNPMELKDFTSIKNKVFIGLADSDQMVSKEETEEVCKQITVSMFYSLPNTKHPIETIDVKIVVQLIRDFINN